MSNALTLTRKALEEPKDLKGMFEIEAFKHNCIDNYAKTTGKSNGAIVFERERVLFMAALRENPQLEKCERFSIYCAFIELFASGLTLQDDIAYIIPYGRKAQFQPGWKGRLEQVSWMPEVQFVNDPIIVYEADTFDYEYIDGKTKILKHKPAKDREKTPITHVYCSIETHFGLKTWIMSAERVLKIRDTYSQSYRSYISACASHGKKVGETFKIQKNGVNGPYEQTVEPPFWITSPERAFKKTLVKQIYDSLPKTPRMKAVDAKIKTNFDPETGSIEEVQDIGYGIEPDTAGELPEVNTAPVATADPSKSTRKKSTKATEKPADKTEEFTPAEVINDAGDAPQDDDNADDQDGHNPVDDLQLGDLSKSF